jgi:hypothetical protein
MNIRIDVPKHLIKKGRERGYSESEIKTAFEQYVDDLISDILDENTYDVDEIYDEILDEIE